MKVRVTAIFEADSFEAIPSMVYEFRELYKGTDTKEIPCECGADGYNQALKECKLALLKKMDGIDKIIEGIETKHNGYFPITELAQAIKDHIVGRNISNETLDTIIEKVKES